MVDSTARAMLVATFAIGLEGDVRDDALVFHVEEDAHVTRLVRVSRDLSLTAESLMIDGEEVEKLGTEIGMQIHLEESFVVRDVFEAVAEGLPRKLRRRFEELSGSQRIEIPGDPAGPSEDELRCPLAHQEIVFQWDEEEQEFVAAFAEGEEGEEYLLRGLEEDMDLRELLPKDEVSTGDTWEIELGKDLLSPGGDLRISDHEEEPDELAAGDLLRQNRRTKITATYEGTVLENDMELASIRLRVESTSTSEHSRSAGTWHFEDSSSVEGMLRWDRARGHARALSLQGRFSWLVRDTSEVEQQSHVVMSEFTGEVHLDMELEDG